jgi:predicted N-acyltransferase
LPQWNSAFGRQRKDHRDYEIVEDALRQDFEFRYFVIKGAGGEVRAIQPFFLLDQDLLGGLGPQMRPLVSALRRVWPRFLKLRALMVGCAAGEGHLDGDESSHGTIARLLASAIIEHARGLQASLIVLKEFPAMYRESLGSFLGRGFSRVPSLPMTRLNIEYPSFEDYMARALNSATRRKLRRQFRAAAQAPQIQMSVAEQITPIIDEIYSLYLQVYERSELHFEQLTKEYFCDLSRLMADKVRFFIWRQEAKIVAFSICMIEGEAIYAEYVGFDYSIALRIHLYHYVVRDIISWAIAHGFRWLRSSGLNYDPKLHMRHQLDPVDLYVRHTFELANLALRWVLPWLEPTRYDPILKKFPNYADLW